MAAVLALTRRVGEPEPDYAARVAANELAMVVKRADLADNTDPARTALLDEETRVRLAAVSYTHLGIHRRERPPLGPHRHRGTGCCRRDRAGDFRAWPGPRHPRQVTPPGALGTQMSDDQIPVTPATAGANPVPVAQDAQDTSSTLQAAAPADVPDAGHLEEPPIRMLHERVLVSMESEKGEHRSEGGILIPSTRCV